MSTLPALNIEQGCKRFCGNRALYLSFLRRFEEDTSFDTLINSLYCGDLQTAFCAAHALKGLSAQLSLDALAHASSALCELLRPQSRSALDDALRLACDTQQLYADTLLQIAAL